MLALAVLLIGVGCQPIQGNPASPLVLSQPTGAPAATAPDLTEPLDPYQELLIHAHMVLGPKQNYPDAPMPPRILIGQLPANLPFVVPLPASARVIGSITSPAESDGSVYATVVQPLDRASTFFETEFEQLGYRPWSDVPGFLPHPDFAANFRILCGPDPTIEVMVVLYEPAPGRTHVQVHVSHTPSGPCLAASLEAATPDDFSPLPELSHPADLLAYELGREAHYTAGSAWFELEGTLSTLELFEHYSQQLVEQGWQQAAVQNGLTLSWSQWSFEDTLGHTWNGFLYILPSGSSSTEHLLLIRTVRQPQ